jgi:hypothetical protein
MDLVRKNISWESSDSKSSFLQENCSFEKIKTLKTIIRQVEQKYTSEWKKRYVKIKQQ